MASNDAPPTPTTEGAAISPEAIEFATRMYNAAREGNIEVFEQALPIGLPPNLTNNKGDTLVCRCTYSQMGQLKHRNGH
jgi:hypothetical protein